MKDKTKWMSRVYLILVIFTFGIVWQICSDKGIVNELFFSSTKKVIADFIDMFVTGYIFPHIKITLYATFVGLAYGIVLGSLTAFLVGNNKVLANVLEPIFVAINGIPLLAIGPLFVFWFGLGIKSKIVMAAINVFFRVFFNMYEQFIADSISSATLSVNSFEALSSAPPSLALSSFGFMTILSFVTLVIL